MNESRYKLKDLRVWQDARKLRNQISDIVDEFPGKEEYRLEDQMIRASRSVSANIAEGYGRFHYQENIQFCRQARGSLFELLDHFTVALDEGYVDEKTNSDYRNKIFGLIKSINAYIKHLQKKKSNSQ